MSDFDALPTRKNDSPQSVLIVEDEARLRDLLVEQLPMMGYRAQAVRLAEQALQLMAEQPADVILLDLNLPVMDGLTFLEKLRELSPRTPVVIMTGFASVEAAQRAIHHDVVEFLTKPCHLGEIEAALGRACRKLAEQSSRVSPVVQVPPPVEPDIPEAESDEANPTTLAEIERQAILDALKRHNGNRSAVAVELGISRRTLYNRIADYRRLNVWPAEWDEP